MNICEAPKKEDNFFLFNDIEEESVQTNEEQQKILKNVITEFKKKNEINQPKKLCSSYTIKQLPNKTKIYCKNNNDGTTTETKIEKEPSGREKIIQTRYDKDHKVISQKVYYNIHINPNNNNNNNNNNINNNNNNNNNNNINNQNNINYNNNRGHIFRAANGFTIETKIQTLPNGRKKEIKIIRDENDIIVDTQEDEIFDNNYMNNPYQNQRNIPMNSNFMGNNMYNMNSNFVNRPNMPMNNMMMNMGRNRIPNNMNMPQMNMNQMNMNMPQMNLPPMNMNNMYSMPPMMNNNIYPFMMPMPMNIPMINPNSIDPNILNSLPEDEVSEASKLAPDNKECVICLGEFCDKEKIIRLPCLHVFHSDCIKSWFNNHNSCPTCKYKLTYQNMNNPRL